jgi:hypothetical protein
MGVIDDKLNTESLHKSYTSEGKWKSELEE